MASKEWRVEHTPGAELCADLLTKAVVTANSCESFRLAVGLTKCPSSSNSSEKLQQVVAAMTALSSLVAHPGVKAAAPIGMSALSAFVACGEEMMNHGETERGPRET